MTQGQFRRAGAARRQSGAATVEYIIVGSAIVLALVAGPNVIHVLWAALQKAYTAFYFAISAAL